MKLFYICFFIIVLSSCTSKAFEDEEIVKIQIRNLQNFDNVDGETRSISEAISSTSAKIDLYYQNGDGFGLFPSSGYQIPFFASDVPNNKSAEVSVLAQGWNTDPDLLYATYYPYNKDIFVSTAIPFSYVGQKQIGNNSENHMKDFMLMVSNVSAANGKSFNFGMTHAGACLKFNLTINASLEAPLSFTKLAMLGPSKDCYGKAGEFNMFSDSQQFENVERTRVLSIDLENVSIANSSDQVTVFMAACAPITLTSNDVIILWDSNGNTYTGFSNRDMIRPAGSGTNINATLELNNAIKTVIEQYAEEDAASGQLNTGN